MADKLKYSTTQPTLPGLRTDDFVLGTGDGNYGPTSTTSYLNGFTAPEGGYVVYTLGLSNTPIGWVASNDAELIDISRHLGNTTLDIKTAKVYLAGLTDTWVFNSTPNNIVTDSLVFDMDIKNLTSYPDAETNVYDISGEGHDGTLVNGVSRNSNGWLIFDGVDDLVTISGGGITDYSQPFSMGVWFYIDPSATWDNGYRSNIYSIGGSYSGQYGIYKFSGDNLGVTLRDADSTIYAEASGYSKGVWYYALSTWDGSILKLYINGEEVSIQSAGGITGTPDTSNLYIGGARAFGGAYGNFYQGNIAKCEYYTKALSETEIKQNYYGGPIVTDGLTFALDAGNLVSYEPTDTSTYSLTGGNIPPGEVVNGVGYTPSYGGGWDFDGVDDFIYFNHNLTNPDEFTIEAVINMTSLGNYNKTIMFSGDSVSEGFWFFKHRSGLGNRLVFHGYDGVNPRIDVISTDPVPDAENVYVAITYVGGVYQLYMNGVPNGPAVNSNPIAPTVENFIGKIGSTYMEGKIYNLRIHNRGLSPSEIQQNFEAQRSRFGI